GGPDICMAEALHRLGGEGVTANEKMFCSLVMTVKGGAQILTRSAVNQGGALAWRALAKRSEPATSVRAHGIMASVPNVKQFPGAVAEFEAESGEVFNAGVKKSTFLQKAPRNMRAELQVQSERCYDELVSATIQHLQAAAVYEGGYQRSQTAPSGSGAGRCRGSAAMGMGALTRRRGCKGDQKGKGKGRGGQWGKGKGYDGEGRGAKRQEGDGKGNDSAVSEVTSDGWIQVGTSGPGSLAPSAIGPAACRTGAQGPRRPGVRAIMRQEATCENKWGRARESEWGRGCILAITTTEHGKVHGASSEGVWNTLWTLLDNCAGERANGRGDFPRAPIAPSKNPNLTVADGCALQPCGSKTVTPRVAGSRNLTMEFHLAGAKQPVMGAGKLCGRAPARVAWRGGMGGLSKHEAAGLAKPMKVNKTTARWSAGR
ncbi:unnamed protein product, partial [Prorocentrum cordatum]